MCGTRKEGKLHPRRLSDFYSPFMRLTYNALINDDAMLSYLNTVEVQFLYWFTLWIKRKLSQKSNSQEAKFTRFLSFLFWKNQLNHILSYKGRFLKNPPQKTV